MKKKTALLTFALLTFMAVISFGGTTFAASPDSEGMNCCKQMSPKECIVMCKEMKKGSSDCCDNMDCCDKNGKVKMNDCMKMMKKQSSMERCC